MRTPLFGKIPARSRGIISAAGRSGAGCTDRDILTRMGATSFTELKTVHAWLDALFLAHQLALLNADFDAADTRLSRYVDALEMHMADEHDYLIPLYDARTSGVPGGHRDVFIGEHHKLTRLVDDCRARLGALRGLERDARQRALVALFDREAFLKTYVEHHHAREENILFPWLDRVTEPDERAALLGRCRSLTASRTAALA